MSVGPLVGIAGAAYVVAKPFGDLAVHGIPRRYLDHVLAAGGRPVILPPGPSDEVLGVLHGLVLAGGGDLDPALYDRVDVQGLEVDRERDDAEITLARRARAAGLPVLGVCRGAQILTVADGGTLVPGSHPLTTQPGSVCARLLGPRPEVNSLHHQAIDRAGSGWRATAWADDGVVEAVEWEGSEWNALGVQWHPELDLTGATLFGWLVRTADSRLASLAS